MAEWILTVAAAAAIATWGVLMSVAAVAKWDRQYKERRGLRW